MKTITEDKKKVAEPHLLQPEVTRGLVEHLKLTALLGRFPERPVWAVFMFINGFITIGILAGIAMISHTPFVFPSLGPTAFLFFFTPTLPTASPRNTIFGHAIGIACGFFALWSCGLLDTPPAIQVGVDGHRVLAAALSLSLTGGLMILLKSAHPPAGATTLIISLGIVRKPFFMLMPMVMVTALRQAQF